MVETVIQPTDTDYRFAISLALIVLIAFIFGCVIYHGGTVSDAVMAGITPFVGLLSIIINSYFKTKES